MTFYKRTIKKIGKSIKPWYQKNPYNLCSNCKGIRYMNCIIVMQKSTFLGKSAAFCMDSVIRHKKLEKVSSLGTKKIPITYTLTVKA